MMISVSVSRRRALSAISGLALFMGLGWSAPTRADSAADAVKMIETLANAAITTLMVDDVTKDDRDQRFRDLLKANFDVDTIAKWVLGRYWTQATPDQQSDYLKLFEDLLVSTYADRFGRYSGEKLTVVDATVRPGEDTVVQTTLTRPNLDSVVKVEWRIRERNGKLLIVDVVVEGVSMGATQRSEFASAIRQNGGLDAFLIELKKRIGKDA